MSVATDDPPILMTPADNSPPFLPATTRLSAERFLLLDVAVSALIVVLAVVVGMKEGSPWPLLPYFALWLLVWRFVPPALAARLDRLSPPADTWAKSVAAVRWVKRLATNNPAAEVPALPERLRPAVMWVNVALAWAACVLVVAALPVWHGWWWTMVPAGVGLRLAWWCGRRYAAQQPIGLTLRGMASGGRQGGVSVGDRARWAAVRSARRAALPQFRRCPACAEDVRWQAEVCSFCDQPLPPADPALDVAYAGAVPGRRSLAARFGIGFGVVVGLYLVAQAGLFVLSVGNRNSNDTYERVKATLETTAGPVPATPSRPINTTSPVPPPSFSWSNATVRHEKVQAWERFVKVLTTEFPDQFDGAARRQAYQESVEAAFEQFAKIEFDPLRHRKAAREIIDSYRAKVAGRYTGGLMMRVKEHVQQMAETLALN